MDEWAKKTWTTEPFMIPYERHVLWHNVIDPEQNYGILALETKGPEEAQVTHKSGGVIEQLRISHDGSFLYLELTLNRNVHFGKEKLLIGLDTYDRNRGEFRFAPEVDARSPSGLEFMIELSDENKGRLLVNPGYNISKSRYASRTGFDGDFEEIRPLINKERITKAGHRIPAHYEDGSLLRYGTLDSNNHNHWYYKGNSLTLRLPWGRINFTDPSSLKVLDDTRNITAPERDQLRTVRTDGIMVHALIRDGETEKVVHEMSSVRPYVWKGWEEPKYRTRVKESYYIVRRFFATLD